MSNTFGRRAAANITLALAALIAQVPAQAQAQAQAQASPPASPVPPAYGAPLTMDEALAMIRTGIALAQADGLLLTFAIVEPSGELIAFARMDGAIYGSIHLAQAKARSAARYRVATAVREQQLTGGRLQILSNDEIIAIGGGVPVVRGGKVVGGVGVSGASAEQDAAVAGAMAAKP